MPGTLFVVATPIGNLEDITLRALRVLREVVVVAAEDTRRTARLLQHYGIPTPTLSFHDHNERVRTPALVARLQAGDSVALVSDAGTPLVSDPGLRLLRATVEAGIAIVAVPGPSAVMAALSISGLPLDRFQFLGFPPARAGERTRWLQALAGSGGTLVFFEAPHRIHATLTGVRDVLGERWIVVCRELTKVHEDVRRGWISALLDAELPQRGEFTILVSDQVRPALTAAGTAIPADEDATIIAEFCRMTENGAASARDAIARIAERRGLKRQRVYRALRDGNIGLVT
jgi:16S rRNA (cytidine1402-2'-O)-methyltransferase